MCYELLDKKIRGCKKGVPSSRRCPSVGVFQGLSVENVSPLGVKKQRHLAPMFQFLSLVKELDH